MEAPTTHNQHRAPPRICPMNECVVSLESIIYETASGSAKNTRQRTLARLAYFWCKEHGAVCLELVCKTAIGNAPWHAACVVSLDHRYWRGAPTGRSWRCDQSSSRSRTLESVPLGNTLPYSHHCICGANHGCQNTHTGNLRARQPSIHQGYLQFERGSRTNATRSG